MAELHERCAAQEAELAAAGAELERLREQQVAAVKLPAPCSAAPSAERLEAEMIEGQLAAMGRLHAQQVAAAAAERQVLADQLRALQGQHASLQLEQQAARDKAAAEIASAQGLAEQSRLALERCMADKSALAAALEAGRGMEAVHRQQSAEAGSRVVALRAELVANSEALHTALASNAALQERNTQLSEELAAADRLVQALRGEISSLRKSLLQAQTASTAQLLAQATQEGQAYVSLAKTLPKPASQLPAAILRYIQVLQYALAEADKRHQALAAAAEQASELEAAVRMQLAASQDAQLAASRALTAQVRRVHSLESMRLGDVRELAAMERQLAAVTQEAWQLREQLVKTSLRTTSADS